MARTKPSETYLAYLAGLFDGEGHVVLESKRSETHLTEEPTSAGTYELK